MGIEVMEHHISILNALSPGRALEYVRDLQNALPDYYAFVSEQQRRDMAVRIELSRRALKRGVATIISDDEQSFICCGCPARVPCFDRPRR